MEYFIKNRLFKLVLVFVIILILIMGYIHVLNKQKTRLREYRITRFYMDTYVEIIVIAPMKQEKMAFKAINKSFEVFQDLDSRLNFYNDKSILSWLNRKKFIKVDNKDLFVILDFSINAAKETKGAFDPTLGVFKQIYPIGKKNPVPPEDGKIIDALHKSGYEKISFKDGYLSKPRNLLIDPGGVLKGYAVEKASKILIKSGFNDFIVNGGGNITARGTNINKKPWKIGIENPRSMGQIIGVICLNNQSIATSGDYQRYFFYNGIRYHHLIDSNTGKPARNAISATVISSDSMTSDVYSTAAFVMGRKKGIEFLEKKGLSGIIIDNKGYSMTKFFKEKINLKKTLK